MSIVIKFKPEDQKELKVSELVSIDVEAGSDKDRIKQIVIDSFDLPDGFSFDGYTIGFVGKSAFLYYGD